MFQEFETQSEVKTYIYTEELKKVLSEEKTRGHTGRDWGDVLEAVDRDFWIEARWSSYQSKNREHLRNLLEIEWNTYKNIRHGLNMDILLMFEENNKMEDIIRQVQYERYFSNYKNLNWAALWKRVSLQYPEKPDNGNVERLLSLYKYSSCHDEEFLNYIKVVDQWKMSSQRETFMEFCDELKRKQLSDYIGSIGMEELREMADKLYAEVFRDVRKEALQAGEEVKRRVIETVLKEANMYHLLDEYLIDQFRFRDRAGFIKEFRKKEWNHLVQLIHEVYLQTNKEVETPVVWWITRVLFLYNGESESVIKEAVSKFRGKEWDTIITELLKSFVAKSSLVDSYLFDETLQKVRLVYNQKVEGSLCSFFSKEESHLLIQDYDPEWIINLLNGLSWFERQTSLGEKIYCSELVSKQERKDLIHKLFQSLLDKKDSERTSNASLESSLSDIWSVAVHIMDLSVKINNLRDSPIWFLDLDTLSNIEDRTDDYDFVVEYFERIQDQLLSVANRDRNLVLDRLTNNIWTEPPVTDHHKIYRDWMVEMLSPSAFIKSMSAPQPRPAFLGVQYMEAPQPRPSSLSSEHLVPPQPLPSTSDDELVEEFFSQNPASDDEL